jgi:hypothetical protein
MSDDWRLHVKLHEEGNARALSERLESAELEHDLEGAFHDRVVVSRDGSDVFCYSDNRRQIDAAADYIRSLSDQHGWQMDTELHRWHPSAERWEEADTPFPDSDAERAAERAEVIAREREESASQGYPEYEVRVQVASHRDALELARKLGEERLAPVRRWRYLLIGAADEEAANALAARIRDEAPDSAVVTVEGNLRAVLDERPPSPFSILGGLGG